MSNDTTQLRALWLADIRRALGAMRAQDEAGGSFRWACNAALDALEAAEPPAKCAGFLCADDPPHLCPHQPDCTCARPGCGLPYSQHEQPRVGEGGDAPPTSPQNPVEAAPGADAQAKAPGALPPLPKELPKPSALQTSGYFLPDPDGPGTFTGALMTGQGGVPLVRSAEASTALMTYYERARLLRAAAEERGREIERLQKALQVRAREAVDQCRWKNEESVRAEQAEAVLAALKAEREAAQAQEPWGYASPGVISGGSGWNAFPAATAIRTANDIPLYAAPRPPREPDAVVTLIAEGDGGVSILDGACITKLEIDRWPGDEFPWAKKLRRLLRGRQSCKVALTVLDEEE